MDDSTQPTLTSNSDNPLPADAAIEQFRQSVSRLGYQQLNEINCATSGDEMVLTGQLDSFYLKQVAQSVAINIHGVRSVKNKIQVV